MAASRRENGVAGLPAGMRAARAGALVRASSRSAGKARVSGDRMNGLERRLVVMPSARSGEGTHARHGSGRLAGGFSGGKCKGAAVAELADEVGPGGFVVAALPQREYVETLM